VSIIEEQWGVALNCQEMAKLGAILFLLLPYS
jgi:hypothetical protein